MKSRKSFLLRINPALYEALAAWAGQEMRSVNGQIEYLLKDAVTRHGRSLPIRDEETDDDLPEAPASE